MNKINTIKDLAIFFETLLNHLKNLTEVTGSVEEAVSNLDRIKELNEFHKGTRENAKILLSQDLSKLSKNPIYLMMGKSLNPTSIEFINFVTDINEKLIQYIEEKDFDNLEKYIKITKDFSTTAEKQFTPLKNQLLKMSKNKL